MPKPLSELNPIQSRLRERGICTIIPTYNNVGSILDVVQRTLSVCSDVIIVCDGATDGTLEVLQTLDDIHLVSYTRNRGKGYALQQGFRRAQALGFAYAITLDADGQHYPEDIPLLLAANEAHPGKLLIGARQLEGVERSAGSDFANKFSNFWVWIQTGYRLPDTQTGFRLYPLRKLYGLRLLPKRYEAEVALLVLSAWHGVGLHSVPIRVFYPSAEERVSHFRPMADFARISILNTVLCFLTVIYAWPLRLGRLALRSLRTIYALLFFLFFSLCLMTPFALIYSQFVRDSKRRGRVMRQMIYKASKLLLMRHGIPGVRFTIDNPNGESFSRPAIIICNHQSHLDLVSLLCQSPKITLLVNDWVWHNPVYGHFIRPAGYQPVSLGIDELESRLKELIAEGCSIAIYPEGTRSMDHRIGRFHKGAFHLAMLLDLDILPMYLYGATHVLPKTGRSLHQGRIHIEIGQRISPEELRKRGTSLRSITRSMHEEFVQHYEHLCHRLDQEA